MAKAKKKVVKKKKPARKVAVKKSVKKLARLPVKKKVPVKAKKKTVKPVRKLAKLVKKPVKIPAKKIPAGKAKKAAKSAAKKSAPKQIVKTLPGLPGQLYEAAMKVLEERQAEQVVTVELEGRSSMADYLIIASGRAQRQIAAIADYLREAFMKLGVRQIRIEGLPEANWVLVDAGDIVVHLFRPEVRNYYRLEDIWGKNR